MKPVVAVPFAALALVASSAWAQMPAGPVGAAVTRLQTRQQMALFEGALENAVRLGTQTFDQRLQTVAAANWVMLAGLTRARGFRLDDYGVVFDVEFPSMRRSMVWSFQELQRASSGQTNRETIQPREIYQTEITNALINAIVDYTGSIVVGPGEWLTVAARESVVDRRLVPRDPSDAAITVILRIKGSDLQAVRDGSLAREEARRRVDVKSY
jgi:hypothetical protein